MSSGAVFKLISNDGKADRMIMATELRAGSKKCGVMWSRVVRHENETPCNTKSMLAKHIQR